MAKKHDDGLEKMNQAQLVQAYSWVQRNNPKAKHPDWYAIRTDMISVIRKIGFDPEAFAKEGAATKSLLITKGDVPVATKGKKAVKKAPAKKGKKAAVKAGTGRTRSGVGATIRALIAKKPDRPNADIAEDAKAKHPDSNTNAACVAWYKNDMRKKGDL